MTIETLPFGWATANVTRTSRKGLEVSRYEILDLRSIPWTRYRHNSMLSSAIKSFLLFTVGLPGYFLLYSAFQLIRLPVATLANRSITVFAHQLKKVLLLPVYFVALECVAFYGIFKPLEGGALFSRIEQSLHSHSYRADVRYAAEDTNWRRCFKDALPAAAPNHTIFAAVCMQSLGDIEDNRIKSCRILDRPELASA